MANQDLASRASKALILPICQLKENQAKTVGMNVFWVGTYCSELEWTGYAYPLRSWGSSQSPDQFVGSPFIQQKRHNYEGPVEKKVLCIFAIPRSKSEKQGQIHGFIGYKESIIVVVFAKKAILTSFKWVSICISVNAFSRNRMSNPEGTL